MAEPVMKKKSLMMPDWSLLPEELLQIVSTHLEDCFDVLHARTVCTTWRSTFPFPSVLLRPSYSLPSFAEVLDVSKDLCTLEKIPLFLFRAKVPSLATDVLSSEYFWGRMATDVPTGEYFLGGIGQDKSEEHMELPSPIQCSVKVNVPSTEPTLMNMNDCQIIPLGHRYRMIGWNPELWSAKYGGVAFLPLNTENEEFVVLVNFTDALLVLKSTEMRWMRVKKTSDASCREVIAFKGRFYATFLNGDISVYDPYTLIGTPLMPSQPHRRGSKYLVRASDDDELFLVEKFNPSRRTDVIRFSLFACRVSKLDEDASTWVEVSDLGDRVFFIGHYGNVSFSAKELPDGCGVSGNSIVNTQEPGSVTHAYTYGVHSVDEEDEFNCWRTVKVNRVNLLTTTPVVADGENRAKQLCTSPVLALRVEL